MDERETAAAAAAGRWVKKRGRIKPRPVQPARELFEVEAAPGNTGTNRMVEY